jgi:hypothetical protein
VGYLIPYLFPNYNEKNLSQKKLLYNGFNPSASMVIDVKQLLRVKIDEYHASLVTEYRLKTSIKKFLFETSRTDGESHRLRTQRTQEGVVKRAKAAATVIANAEASIILEEQNNANIIKKTDAFTINSGLQDNIRAGEALSLDRRNTCSDLFLEADEMITQLTLPAALKSCLEEQATLSDSLT